MKLLFTEAMEFNLSVLDILTNYSFHFPNISEETFNEMHVEQLDIVIEMFSSEQREISDPAYTVIILCYAILVIIAGKNRVETKSIKDQELYL